MGSGKSLKVFSLRFPSQTWRYLATHCALPLGALMQGRCLVLFSPCNCSLYPLFLNCALIMRLFPANPDSVFEYPVTRPFTIPYLTPFVLGTGIIYITFITLFAVITVGYEYVAVPSVSYNLTLSTWYDFLPQTSWTPLPRSCQGSVIKVGEGIIYFQWAG
jgi:hypothetical protein